MLFLLVVTEPFCWSKNVQTATVFLTCFDMTTFLRNHVLKWRRYHVFPAKTTLVRVHSMSLYEKISHSFSCASYNPNAPILYDTATKNYGPANARTRRNDDKCSMIMIFNSVPISTCWTDYTSKRHHAIGDVLFATLMLLSMLCCCFCFCYFSLSIPLAGPGEGLSPSQFFNFWT